MALSEDDIVTAQQLTEQRIRRAAPAYYAAAEMIAQNGGDPNTRNDDPATCEDYAVIPRAAYDALMAAHREAKGK